MYILCSFLCRCSFYFRNQYPNLARYPNTQQNRFQVTPKKMRRKTRYKRVKIEWEKGIKNNSNSSSIEIRIVYIYFCFYLTCFFCLIFVEKSWKIPTSAGMCEHIFVWYLRSLFGSLFHANNYFSFLYFASTLSVRAIFEYQSAYVRVLWIRFCWWFVGAWLLLRRKMCVEWGKRTQTTFGFLWS